MSNDNASNSRFTTVPDYNTGADKPWERFSSRLEKFLAKYPLEDGYTVQHAVAPATSMFPDLVEMYKDAIKAGMKPLDIGLPPLPRGTLFTASLKDSQGNVLATGQTLSTLDMVFDPASRAKEFEMQQSGAYQRMIAGLGFSGDVFDRDEDAAIARQRALAAEDSPSNSRGQGPARVTPIRKSNNAAITGLSTSSHGSTSNRLELPDTKDPCSLFDEVRGLQKDGQGVALVAAVAPPGESSEVASQAVDDNKQRERTDEATLSDMFKDLSTTKPGDTESHAASESLSSSEDEEEAAQSVTADQSSKPTESQPDGSANARAVMPGAEVVPLRTTRKVQVGKVSDEGRLNGMKALIRGMALRAGVAANEVKTIDEARKEQTRLCGLLGGK